MASKRTRARTTIPDDWAPDSVKALRKKLGKTTTELGAATGVSSNTVENWESGRTRPNLKQFLQLLRALDCQFWDLMP